MSPTKHHRLSALVAGLAMVALPGQANACWLFDCCGHHSRSTFYAPVVAAPACNTCAQQTVSYVPQTAYRPLVTTTPVTALRPVMATDPCTGCPSTVMQPTTSYVQRTVMMPYTTYRPVMQTSYFAPAVAAPVIAAPTCATGACGAAPATTYYQPAAIAPAITTPAPVISQPGCCGASAAPTTYTTPMSSTTTVPSLGTAPGYSSPAVSPPRTFNNASESPSDQKPSDALKPVPEVKDNGAKGNGPSLPKLLDPLNRTTSTMAPAWSYTPVAMKDARPASQSSNAPALEDSGWEAAR